MTWKWCTTKLLEMAEFSRKKSLGNIEHLVNISCWSGSVIHILYVWRKIRCETALHVSVQKYVFTFASPSHLWQFYIYFDSFYLLFYEKNRFAGRVLNVYVILLLPYHMTFALSVRYIMHVYVFYVYYFDCGLVCFSFWVFGYYWHTNQFIGVVVVYVFCF